MINHKRLGIVFLIFLLALTNQVHGFVSVRLSNAASVKISSSADALVGIPENLALTLGTTNPDALPLSEAAAADIIILENNVEIINNMAQTIDVFITGSCSSISFDDFSIFAGETGKASVSIIGPVSCGIVDLEIHVGWDSGSAVIYKSLVIRED